MPKFVLLNARLFAVGADLTGASNKIELTAEIEDKETTNYYSNGHKEVIGGLGSAEIAAEGQWEAGDATLVDNASWAQLGGVGPWTVCPDGAAVADRAYLTQCLRSEYGLGGSIGDVAPWTGKGASSWPLVRGQMAHPAGTARTSTGVGTAVQLGAVPAGKRLYAALHVLSVAGTTPSITARIESDNAVGFPSATTQLTFTAATAAGAEALRTSGSAITDDWFRVAWTISGTTPSFLFATSFGIR
ncbi:hypothetical protein [Streptomyces antarcticus]|uniref:hypothetical protein n=1 Tax=Streptomyces antarcticus TaxID=2996458 RepID=UPI00227173FC|nr:MULTISPECIES: hypothetical protein [unclassified Streptomyces]MCY0943535.1 hypothetical protein [Streptomyces sp. H34-AA3]MCZ4083556.1 hypothetical protein [Streptomyces sp. H34-S5]